MTTNKSGSVNQDPLYGCTSCYEECTWHASDLHVHDGECWCDTCWDWRSEEFPDQPNWNDLEPYTPALQAECEKLRKDAERLKARVAELESERDSIKDLAVFMCRTWKSIDDFVYANCNGDQLMKYPVIQGTSNQFRLARVGGLKYDKLKIPFAVDALLKEPANEGDRHA